MCEKLEHPCRAKVESLLDLPHLFKNQEEV